MLKKLVNKKNNVFRQYSILRYQELYERNNNDTAKFCNAKKVTKQELRTYAKDKIHPCAKSCETLQNEPCTADPCFLDPCLPQPKVVIIGAGMAGLSAAHRLSSCGFKNFEVIEATDRPGGRIHSCWLGNVVGELGAQWISGGSEANPIFTLACREDLLKDPLWKRKNGDDMICLTSDGRAIEPYTAAIGKGIFQQIKGQAFSLFSVDTQKNHGSLKKFIETRVQEELNMIPKEWRMDVKKVINGLINTIQTRWGTELTKMSADGFGSFIKIPGPAVRVPLGFVGVLGPLLRSIPKTKISYCKQIDFIKWDNCSPRVLIRSCGGDLIGADFCIITCSLGVLKENHDKLFQPALPEEKVDAIKALGFGHLNKIILEYGRPFWACGEGGILVTWDSQELLDSTPWLKGVSMIEEAPGGSNMLMTTVGGPEACAMEECTDEEIALTITQLLRSLTGDFSLPLPINVIRSKWSSDRFFKGAGTYMGMNSKVSDQCELGRPLPGICNPGPPTLLFAGEATAPGHFSTVQGARISGVREAERILHLVKKYRGVIPKEEEEAAATC